MRRPSPAMVVACISLSIALSGVGYAAIVLPANSVGTKQIRNGQVKRADVAGSAVNSGKVADNSLTGADVNESLLGQVPSAANATNAANAANAAEAAHAASADNATNAANAANATNASNLTCSGCVGTADLAAGSVTSSKLAVDEGWHQIEPAGTAGGDPDFVNGWTNYGSSFSTAAYYKDARGVVHLKGLIKSGSVGSTAFVIPYGLDPLQDRLVSTISNNGVGRVVLFWNSSALTSVIIEAPSSNAWVSLDNISFRSAPPSGASSVAKVTRGQ